MIKETPSDDFLPKISQFLAKSLDKQGWILECEDLQLATEEVSSEEGLLPLIVWIASDHIQKMWGPQELGFRVNSNALCGVVLDLDRPIVPMAVWLHAVHYEVERAATSPSVSNVVNDWFTRWNEALSQKTLRLFPPRPQSPSVGASGSGGV